MELFSDIFLPSFANSLSMELFSDIFLPSFANNLNKLDRPTEKLKFQHPNGSDGAIRMVWFVEVLKICGSVFVRINFIIVATIMAEHVNIFY